MRMLLRLVLIAASVSLAAAPAAGAGSFKSCGKLKIDGSNAGYSVKGISCRSAKKVLARAGYSLCFDNRIKGWTKVWTPVAGGRALSLKSGAKVIKTKACSPR